MEEKEIKLATEITKNDGGLVFTSLKNKKTTLVIYAEFAVPVTLVDPTLQSARFKKGHIKLNSGGKVPTKLLEILYYENVGNNRRIYLEYPLQHVGQWDFITVKFKHKNADAEADQKKALNHVSGSSVHYGDADED